MERIELIHVNKKLGGKEVLKGVDLTLEEGKLYGIIGENGSGKTMLLRLLAGLIHPDDGEVHTKLDKGFINIFLRNETASIFGTGDRSLV